MKSWPHGVMDLLIQAALSPIPQAVQAWESWKVERRFEDISWQETRLLGAVYARLPELDPDTALRPRIDGILKNRWVLAQHKLHETCEAFDCLSEKGIPFVVFKGGAFQAEGFRAANRRVLGDIDILVRSDDACIALDALHQGGWASANGESLEYLRQLANHRLNGNFRKGHYGNVDLHISPFHYSRNDKALSEELWHRARPAMLGSRPILAPAPTDSILIALAHATESTNGDWTLDVATRITEQEIDWEYLTAMAERLGIVSACMAGLAYLSSRIGVPVPDFVLTRLEAAKTPASQRLKYWSNVTDRADRTLPEKFGNRLADTMLLRDGFSVVEKDRTAISVKRSTIALGIFLKRNRSNLGSASELCLQHHVDLPPVTGRSILILKLTFRQPIRSRRLFFDVCLNGVAVARLRTRAGGRSPEKPTTRWFRFRIPEVGEPSVSVQISARPSRYLRPNATEAEIEDFGQFAFQVAGVWAV